MKRLSLVLCLILAVSAQAQQFRTLPPRPKTIAYRPFAYVADFKITQLPAAAAARSTPQALVSSLITPAQQASAAPQKLSATVPMSSVSMRQWAIGGRQPQPVTQF